MTLNWTTVLLTTVLVRVLQAAVFVYMQRIHRGYAPARLWAFGSVLLAAGAALVVVRGAVPDWLSVLAGNVLIFAGLMVFDGGIVAACEGRSPWRIGLAVVAAAALAHAWFFLAEPSIAARIWNLSLVVLAFDGYAAFVAWRAPPSALRRTQRIIAIVLLVECALAMGRGLGTAGMDEAFVLATSPTQAAYLLGGIGTAFVVSMALVLLVSERLQAELRHAASHDPLTGLFNRRAFIEAADREWSRLRRRRGSGAVAMIDLDYFKQFNDRHGHAAGDRALQEVAGVVARGLRRGDLVCRYGGEEFAVLLPDAHVREATPIVERLRHAVSALPVPEGRPLTLSVGVAASRADESEWGPLLDAADRALYEAKSQGRDRVAAADDVQATVPASRA